MDEVIIEKQEYLLFDKYKLNTNRNITRYEYISNVPLKVSKREPDMRVCKCGAHLITLAYIFDNNIFRSRTLLGRKCPCCGHNYFTLKTIAGYKGFIILIDELAYICNTANGITRQNNYEKILMMYNAALQGKAEYLGIIMGGIPKSIYDKKKGIFSYEAMRSRLSTGSYQDTGIINMMTPIIKVFPLTKEEMYVLLEKLAEIHAQLYEYEKVITEDEMIDFVKLAYLKRETTFITPRTMIRDFIQILDVKRQNPDKGIRDILSAYKFAVDEEQTYEDND